MRALASVVFALVATVANAFSVSNGVASESWLGNVKDTALLCDLVLPGTHDSAAYDLGIPVGRDLVVTQSSNITEQLTRGIRYLDMRVGICAGTTDKLCMYHGEVYLRLNFDSALDMIKQFLVHYPSETVVVRLQRERVAGLEDFQGFVEANYLKKEPGLWVPANTTKEAAALTVRDVRGKILLFWSSGAKTSAFGYDYDVVNTRDKYEFDSIGEMSDLFEKRAGGSGVDGWYENPTSGLVYFTVFGQRWFSPDAIDKTAKKMMDRVAKVLEKTPMKKGIVSMDYPTDDLIKTLISASLAH